VEANNSCARTLIFGSFLLLPFVKFFSLPLFHFFDLVFYCLFSFFNLFFITLCFPLLFRSCFVPVFFVAHVVSSLAYPNLLGNKKLGCCCCCVPNKRRRINDITSSQIIYKGNKTYQENRGPE
jgi:hypothetical protein